MSKIQLYSEEGCGGDEAKILEDTDDFQSMTVIKNVQSIKVWDGIWIVFSDADYKGEIAVYKEGKYDRGIKIKNIGSMRKLPDGLVNHIITVFSDTGYKGDSQRLTGKSYTEMAFSVLSHKVEKGVWLLYDDTEFNGNRIVSIIGDNVSDATAKALDGPLKSLQAYTTYEKPN
ncbi:epidermal differentiation-specific protein-like [Ranitomeya variabilis]|uniref:epidermal differentiation-specific protein-like n=1 Tax=Ranitomeya variabilis TaxID=490064 RepID=UPI004055AD46